MTSIESSYLTTACIVSVNLGIAAWGSWKTRDLVLRAARAFLASLTVAAWFVFILVRMAVDGTNTCGQLSRVDVAQAGSRVIVVCRDVDGGREMREVTP